MCYARNDTRQFKTNPSSMCTISGPKFRSLFSFVIKNLVLFLYSVEISVCDTRHVTNRGIQSTLDCDIYCQTEHLIGVSTANTILTFSIVHAFYLMTSVFNRSVTISFEMCAVVPFKSKQCQQQNCYRPRNL